MDAQNRALEVYILVAEDSQHFDRSRIRVRIEVKSCIRIRIKVMRIRNPGKKMNRTKTKDILNYIT